MRGSANLARRARHVNVLRVYLSREAIDVGALLSGPFAAEARGEPHEWPARKDGLPCCRRSFFEGFVLPELG
jgi:hypothetical protein